MELKLSQAQLVLTQGALKTTNRDLDVALTKENLFFKVGVEDVIHLTRDGSFHLSPVNGNQNMLVTARGRSGT